MVPIAEWMGVDLSDSSSQTAKMVFPNLGNFNRSSHIIPKTTLFTS